MSLGPLQMAILQEIEYQSLLVFEDMCWYKADYSMADPLHFGKKAGCDFLEKKCVEPSTGTP